MEFTLDLIAEPGVLSPCHFSARKTTEMRVLSHRTTARTTYSPFEVEVG